METVTAICISVLSAAAVLCLARALRPGSSLADRIVALDSLLVLLVGGVAVLTARRGDDVFVDIAFVAALLGFLGTITVARYIERRGA
ncbi:MAG TPA: monovalent cation/H+ antiporter complex subunit F [Acidimicrobiales bacterium]|nr:monovalent cation/H+ antiporter complex subunit F [Acidimicrobiales bacterium]